MLALPIARYSVNTTPAGGMGGGGGVAVAIRQFRPGNHTENGEESERTNMPINFQVRTQIYAIFDLRPVHTEYVTPSFS